MIAPTVAWRQHYNEYRDAFPLRDRNLLIVIDAPTAARVRTIVAELTEGCTMVSLVGHEYMQQPGVFYEVLSTLHDGQIPVLQTTDSDFSLSVLIPESETNRAVRLLHEQFKLSEIV